MLGNEPAFPCEKETQVDVDHYVTIPWPGMTIRQYFVAQAMKGLSPLNGAMEGAWMIQDIANFAVLIADACLAREAETRKPR